MKLAENVNYFDIQVVVYFSFAPVISASIHRYVKYFDIQVLMMVTETETLTSTLHHNIFTYLDYVFSATFMYIYLLVELATVVENKPKAPFSIATTPRCRRGRYSFPGIAPLYPWCVPYNAEC